MSRFERLVLIILSTAYVAFYGLHINLERERFEFDQARFMIEFMRKPSAADMPPTINKI